MAATGELRCDSKLHGLLIDEKIIEIKCDSRFCGARPGFTVLHKFDATTGQLLDTERYMNPPSPDRRESR